MTIYDNKHIIFYTNFTEVFDRINHEIVFNKLQSFSFCGSLWSWFRPFHSNRHIINKRQYFESNNSMTL